MADFSRETREHWLKQHFSKNEVAKSGRDKGNIEYLAWWRKPLAQETDNVI